jgi:hypothetical protein
VEVVEVEQFLLELVFLVYLEFLVALAVLLEIA